MQRYWDLTEKQRAELTREQVTALLDVELMEKGVKKVDPPQLVDVGEITIPTATCYEVHYRGEYGSTGSGFAFATAFDAEAFMALKPLKIDHRWQWGSDNKFAMPMRDMKIVSIALPNEQVMIERAAKLEQIKAAQEANGRALAAYDEAVKAVKKAVEGVWTDYSECLEKARRVANVEKTRAEYMQLCDNNAELAETFLAKAFKEEELQEAAEWNTAI